MSHTFEYEKEDDHLFRFHYNSDMSGDVTIARIEWVPQEPGNPTTYFDDKVVAEVKIPGEALIEFVMERMKEKFIANVEQMTTEEFIALTIAQP
jgi:hypothetical protein